MNIIGRLTADAVTSTVKNDQQVVNFSVAVNESYKNKQGERIKLTEYYSCAYWLTAKVAKILTKGTMVELTGWASARAYTDRNGEPKARLNFHTSKINLLFSKNGGRPQETEPLQAGNNSNANEGDDLPF